MPVIRVCSYNSKRMVCVVKMCIRWRTPLVFMAELLTFTVT